MALARQRGLCTSFKYILRMRVHINLIVSPTGDNLVSDYSGPPTMSSATVFGVGSSNDPEIMLADVVRQLAAIEDLVCSYKQ
jgi:hypothetical protein